MHGKRGAEAVVHAEFLEHLAHMALDRVEADAEQLCDRFVRFAVGDPARDVALARREVGTEVDQALHRRHRLRRTLQRLAIDARDVRAQVLQAVAFGVGERGRADHAMRGDRQRVTLMTWLIHVPVSPSSPAGTLDFDFNADGLAPLSDHVTIVIFRDGFDGAGASMEGTPR